MYIELKIFLLLFLIHIFIYYFIYACFFPADSSMPSKVQNQSKPPAATTRLKLVEPKRLQVNYKMLEYKFSL